MTEHQSSTSSRRPSQRSRTSIYSSNPDVFSDEFALEPFEITNGFGLPSREGDGFNNAALPPGRHNHTERSLAQQHPAESTQCFPRRSIGSQRYSGRNSLTSRADTSAPLSSHPAGIAPVSDNPNGAATPHRSISSTSTFTMPRTQIPYQGATGPSQPYGLYPQNIGISRTPSSATTSTIRIPERIYTGPVGPTQPYGMYPQNTVPEDEVSPVDGIAPTPIGFPGLGQDYRRRFGPDGEEAADLVGPDGHTEQLPPYTRYPNDIPSKDGPPPTVPPAVSPVSVVSPVAAPGNRPEASQDTLTAARSNSSDVRRSTVEDSFTHLNATSPDATAPPDDSGHFKENMTEKSKKRVCWDRLPIWAIILLLLAVGILIGAVIGGILGHKAGQEKATEATHSPQEMPQAAAPSTVFVTTTSLVDAVPITSTPPNLPPLPTGTFTLKLGAPSNSTNTCVNNKAQSAWQCTSGQDLNFKIQPDHWFNLLHPDPKAPVRYGAQPPQLLGSARMQLMSDKEGLSRGPAFFFQQAFDKIVVVREPDFSTTSVKRSFSETGEYDELAALEDRDLNLNGPPDAIASPTSKPWYCYWNGTILEGFIFVEQDTNSSNASRPASLQTSGEPPFASDSMPSMTSMGSLAAPSTSGSWSKRDMPTNLAAFPKVVKIEERRNAQNPVQPYCQQMQILNDNTPGTLTDGTGKLIRVNLTENEPQQGQSVTHGPPSRRRNWQFGRDHAVEERDVAGSICQCQWLSS